MNNAKPEAELTPEAINAINSYLLRYIKLISAAVGIVNGAFLLGSLAYVFFVLPKHAAEEARVSMEQRLQTVTTEYTKTVAGILVKSGEANAELMRMDATTKQNARQASELTTKINELYKLVTTTTQTDAAKALVVAKELNQYPNASAIAEQVANLKKELESLANGLAQPPARMQPTHTKHGGEYEDITCPPGTYIYGVSIGTQSGGAHGQVFSVQPMYKPFLPPTR